MTLQKFCPVLSEKFTLKNLLWTWYYEQVYSTIDSTLHFLKNTKEISDSFKESLRNFIKHLKELLRLKTNHNNSIKIEFLEKQIREEKFLPLRDWLLKKVDEIKIDIVRTNN